MCAVKAFERKTIPTSLGSCDGSMAVWSAAVMLLWVEGEAEAALQSVCLGKVAVWGA